MEVLEGVCARHIRLLAFRTRFFCRIGEHRARGRARGSARSYAKLMVTVAQLLGDLTLPCG